MRARKTVQEDPETDRSWGVKERVGREGTTAQRVRGVGGGALRQKAVSHL